MSNEKLVCPICGEPTRVYMGNARKDRLCGKHADMLKAGELVQCEKCEGWNGSGVKCKCKKPDHLSNMKRQSKEDDLPDWLKPKKENTEKEQPKESTSDLTCIICGEPSNGKHFCLNCYKEFKDHSVDIRITNCRDTEIIDRYGNKKVKTKDGRFVRSLSEKIILDYFFDHFTRVVYEKTVSYVNEKGENAELHPDFYLTDYDLYLEFNGLTNKTYLKKKDYVNKIYASKGFKVVILDSNDINDIESTLDKVLEEHKK